MDAGARRRRRRLPSVYRGVRLSVNAQLVLTALSALPFLVLAVAVVATGGAVGNRADVWLPTAAGHGDVLRAFLFSVLLFGGFEAAAALGEEARLPHRCIPQAILLTIALAGAFYLIVVYAATIGLRSERDGAGVGREPQRPCGAGRGLRGLSPRCALGTGGDPRPICRAGRAGQRGVPTPMISALERPEETGSTLQAHRGGMRRGGPAAAAEDFLTHVSKGALDCVDRSVREHNHHRHTALGGQPPVTCVDNLPAYYNWLT